MAAQPRDDMQELRRVVKSDKGTKAAATAVRRLTPKPDVLRELYLLSGNRCAMTGCRNVIVDDKGTAIGQVCHIEAALPDGPRFNPKQTNEQRRALANLILVCANHHLQIDSRKHEADWPLAKVRKLKAAHEARFKAIPGTLAQRFVAQFEDVTDALAPSDPGLFRRLEAVIPTCELERSQATKRGKQVRTFIGRFAKVPDRERQFVLGVIKRALKLDPRCENVSVHVEDIRSALSVGANRLRQFGAAMKRLKVGDVREVGMADGDEPHVWVRNPSDYLCWWEIGEFCDLAGCTLDDLVIHLKFGLLEVDAVSGAEAEPG